MMRHFTLTQSGFGYNFTELHRLAFFLLESQRYLPI